MESLDKILRLADDKLNEIAREGSFRSREDVETSMQLVKMIKDSYCAMEYEDGEGEESYMDNGPRRIYRDGREYHARGRGRNARRDSRGRYADGYRDGYGYHNGYGDDGFADKLHDLMQNAPDEQSRNSIRKMLENMNA